MHWISSYFISKIDNVKTWNYSGGYNIKVQSLASLF